MSNPKFLDRLDGCACLYILVGTAPREDEYQDVARVLQSFEDEHPTQGMQALINKIKRKQLTPSQVVDQVRDIARVASKVKP